MKRSWHRWTEAFQLSGSIKIWDQVPDHGFTGIYPSVRRYVSRLKNKMVPPCRRMEAGPGKEAQFDIGTGAHLIDEKGKRRRTLARRVVLSHSRKGRDESVDRKKTDYLIAVLENAFWRSPQDVNAGQTEGVATKPRDTFGSTDELDMTWPRTRFVFSIYTPQF